MRGAFVRALTEIAQKDSRVFLLTGDLGYWALEPFADRFPDRFINVGVAEQNMVGIATGMAEAGFIPFVYSIVTFACLRPFEFIRNGPVVHNLPVRIVGVGAGMEYGNNGITHYGLEDVGVMRTQPGLRVVAPADGQQTEAALNSTYDLAGPIYYRLGKDDKVMVPGLDGRFEINKSQVVRQGTDLLIISTGAISSEAVKAAEDLESRGVSAAVVVVSTLNPTPVHDLLGHLHKFDSVMTVEAHYVQGGLGSMVSEIIAEYGLNCKLIRNGVDRMPDGITGGQAFLYDKFGIAAPALSAKGQGLVYSAPAVTPLKP